jgi:hypothetical protein
MAKSTLIFFPFLFVFLSCDIINPEEEIPSYINISRFDVEGINDLPPSAEVRDVWVTINNEFIGVYEFKEDGLTIPVLKSGPSDLVLRPGIIKDAGFNDIHQSYPYYTGYFENIELLTGEVVDVNPNTRYTDDAFFVPEATDDFETGLNRQYRSCLGCPLNLEILNRDSSNLDLFTDINGTSIGYITIPEGATDSINFRTRSAFAVPVNASQIWLEFDYKSNVIFTTALEFNSQFYFRIRPFLVASPNEWRKVYLSLIDDFSLSKTSSFNLIFSSPPSTGDQEYYLAIDNIRLVVPNN